METARKHANLTVCSEVHSTVNISSKPAVTHLQKTKNPSNPHCLQNAQLDPQQNASMHLLPPGQATSRMTPATPKKVPAADRAGFGNTHVATIRGDVHFLLLGSLVEIGWFLEPPGCILQPSLVRTSSALPNGLSPLCLARDSATDLFLKCLEHLITYIYI